MWDKKRQHIWLVTAIVVVTFFVFQEARDETGRLDLGYFAQLEIIFLLAVALMFYFYARQK